MMIKIIVQSAVDCLYCAIFFQVDGMQCKSLEFEAKITKKEGL